MSKKMTLSADGTTATVGEASMIDVLTTAISTDSAITGTLGLVQKAGLVVLGMSLQSKRKLGTFSPL